MHLNISYTKQIDLVATGVLDASVKLHENRPMWWNYQYINFQQFVHASARHIWY